MAATNNLLRFLTAEAKLPLAAAIAQATGLSKANLVTIEDLAKTDFETLKAASANDKAAKATLAAAKRVSIKRKRGLPEESTSSSSKRPRADPTEIKSPADVEASLALPSSNLNEDELAGIILTTNRAPLLLTFAAVLLGYTMPDQPLSSRLGLAQAVTSINAQAKAASIGIDKSGSAEKEGWGQGQPLVKVMTRDIRVLKRWGYEWKTDTKNSEHVIKTEEPDQKLPAAESDLPANVMSSEDSPALLALDLEQLKRLDGPPIVSASASTTGLPIYQADSAHNYILKAFDSVFEDKPEAKKKKRPVSEIAAEREANLGHLVKALDMLFQSWSVLDPAELDKRAWSWYVKVRPQVEGGRAGWGAKGQVKLRDILNLSRPK
ncbi:hypothetical protein D6C86_09867 [Aureobasidium pullulans]|uniref:Impact N-terminal domain-containing protein n=1 Tax=Aureobasidium pullulans TaxID=5580 RepID=A0A4S9PFE3_AURPU|nr:hypothetical protein D6C94_10251 [Aureobasidium pullulans]THZ38827.1 hypothetical protein D6C87_07555 [Aureobasidium pullulans]THZ53456.1 hypothetical protein D6C86_09867 [Aureobasidium pullulans]